MYLRGGSRINRAFISIHVSSLGNVAGAFKAPVQLGYRTIQIDGGGSISFDEAVR